MYLFIETICIREGQILNLPLHQQRLQNTMKHFWPYAQIPCLSQALHPTSEMQYVKARVVYAETGIQTIEYQPYQPRIIHSVKLINCDDIEYSYKSADRHRLNQLYAQRDTADEIIIVKQGLITDTSFSNLAVSDGKLWYTPAHPLLAGTKRAELLQRGILLEKDIKAEEWKNYQRLRLFNALNDWGSIELPIL